MKLGFPSTPICRDPGISSGYPVSHSIHPRLSIIQHLGDDDVDDELTLSRSHLIKMQIKVRKLENLKRGSKLSR